MCSERVASKLHATRQDVWQTEKHFQDSPGREPVSASSSMSIPGVPSPGRCRSPSRWGDRSQTVSSPEVGEGVISPNRGRITSLDIKDGRLPQSPQAWHGH